MKRILSAILVLCLLFALFGCAAKPTPLELVSEIEYIYLPAVADAEWEQALSLADNRTQADRLITKEYALSVFANNTTGSWAQGGWYSGMAISQLHLQYTFGLEVLRKRDNGHYYAAYKIREGGWFYIFLCNEEIENAEIPYVVMSHSLYVSDALNKQALRGIEVGDSRAAVEAADPATTVNRAPETGKSSLHWVDNEIFIFTYDELGETVTGVEHYPDGRVPSSVDGWYFDYNVLPVDCR